MTVNGFFSVRTITLVVVLFLFSPYFLKAASSKELPILFQQSKSHVAVKKPNLATRDLKVDIDFSLIKPSRNSKPAIKAFLPDRSVVLMKKKIQTRGPDNYTWFGKVKGYKLSTVVMTVVKGVLHGHIDFDGKVYTVGPYNNDGYLINKADSAEKVPFYDDARIPKRHKKVSKSAGFDYYEQEDGSKIDVLILYTPAMLDTYGNGLASKIQSFADLANTSYENSNINTRLSIVGTELFDDPNIDENADCGLSYCIDNALSYITCGTTDSGACMDDESPVPPAQIVTLREKYKADLVSLLRVYQPWGYPPCGLAWVMQPVDNSFADFAFSVVEVNNLYCDEITFAHELGHNMGCAHDRENSNAAGAFSYSYGYDRQNVNGTGIFGTVMSYDGPVITYFSNPNVTWTDTNTNIQYAIGLPEGHKDAYGNDDSADNARTINNTRLTVANFRVSGTHTITVTAATHGSLSPSKAVLGNGDSQTFTIIPENGYHLKSLMDNGLDVTDSVSGNSYTVLNVIAEHSLEAVFALDVNPNAVISASPVSANFGYENVGITSVGKTFTLQNTGTDGLILDSITITGIDAAMFAISSTTCSPITLTVPASGTCSLTVTFLPASAGPKTAVLRITSNASASPTLDLPLSGIGGYYIEVAKSGTGTGAVTSSPSGINCGTDCSGIYDQGSIVTLTPVADNGFVFTGWSGGGCSGTGQCSITINGNKVYVVATFMTTHNISATAGAGGNITPSGTTAVAEGNSRSFTITPEQGYHVKSILIDKADITGTLTPSGKVYTYTFNDLKTARTIDVTFTIDLDPDVSVSVTPEAGDFGNVAIVETSPSRTFTIRNTGTTDLVITSTGLSGTDAGLFSMSADTGCANLPAVIGKGLTCGINILFSPSSIGDKSATLRISSNASESPDLDITLKGTGILPEYTLWAKSYGGSGNESSSFVRQTDDGGYIVSGATDSFGKGGNDYWLLKLDSGGNIEWQKSYGGPGDDKPDSIRQTRDGGYIAAGTSDSFGDGDTDFWILKLDSKGEIVWQKTYGGTGNDDGPLIQQTIDGGYIIGGTTYSFYSGYADYWFISLDPAGNVRWEKAVGGDAFDRLSSVSQTSDGGYIAAGSTSSFTDGGNDFWVIRLDIDGNIDWQKAYGGAGNDDDPVVRQTAEKGYILAGTSYSSGDGNIQVLRLDAAGNILWQKTFGGPEDDFAVDINEALDGGYILAGTTYSFSSDGDIWLFKLDSNGNIQSEKTYDNKGNEYASSIQQTLDGGYILAGTSYPSEPSVQAVQGKSDIWILKLDGQGNIKECSISVASNAALTDYVPATNNTNKEGTATAATVRQTDILSASTSAENVLKPACYSNLPLSMLRITNTGQGVGKITSEGLDCGSDCFEAYNYGSAVILNAAANPGSAFDRWDGDCTVNADGTCTTTMTTARNVTATFIISGRPFNISGTIMAGKAPLAGVVISLGGDKTKVTSSDAKGKYNLSDLPAGNYTITPEMSGYSFTPATYSVKIGNADIKGLKFVTYSITGTLSKGGKKPLIGASVVLNGENIIRTVITDSKGKYIFNGLVPGSYSVIPDVSGYAFVPAVRTVTINKSNISRQNFISYSVSGTIKTTDKKPLHGVEVLLDGIGVTKTAITDPGGKYNFTGLAKGSYKIRPVLEGYSFMPENRSVKISRANASGKNFKGKGL